jgi:hypothetical protein
MNTNCKNPVNQPIYDALILKSNQYSSTATDNNDDIYKAKAVAKVANSVLNTDLDLFKQQSLPYNYFRFILPGCGIHCEQFINDIINKKINDDNQDTPKYAIQKIIKNYCADNGLQFNTSLYDDYYKDIEDDYDDYNDYLLYQEKKEFDVTKDKYVRTKVIRSDNSRALLWCKKYSKNLRQQKRNIKFSKGIKHYCNIMNIKYSPDLHIAFHKWYTNNSSQQKIYLPNTVVRHWFYSLPKTVTL